MCLGNGGNAVEQHSHPTVRHHRDFADGVANQKACLNGARGTVGQQQSLIHPIDDLPVDLFDTGLGVDDDQVKPLQD